MPTMNDIYASAAPAYAPSADTALRFEANAKASDVAKLFVYGSVGGYGETSTRQTVVDIHRSKAKTIQVYINSTGGSAFDGLAIYNALRKSPARIEVHIDGLAASAASVIAMAGDEIRMPRGSFIMIHNPSTYTGGGAAHLKSVAARLEQMHEEFADIYSARTGLDRDEVKKQLDAETWFTATEAKAKGYADVIEEGKPIKATASGDVAIFAGVAVPRDFLPPEIFSSLQPAPEAPTPSPEPTKEAVKMDMETLKREHPELYAQITANAAQAAQNAVDRARTEGAAAERDRLSAIDEAAVPGYEELVASAKADPTQSASTLALAIVQRIRAQGASYLAGRASDAAPVNAVGTAPSASAHQTGAESTAAASKALVEAMLKDMEELGDEFDKD